MSSLVRARNRRPASSRYLGEESMALLQPDSHNGVERMRDLPSEGKLVEQRSRSVRT
jgi:hypothetical protein